MRSTVTIIGLTEFTDEEIWNDFTVPNGIERDIVIDTILVECGELELLYSEPRLLARLIKNWAAAEQLIWQKLYESLHFDYNPIWNKDGTVVETEARNHISKNFDSGSESSRSEGMTGRDVSASGENTEQVSAYNTSEFNNRNKNTAKNSSQENIVSDSEIGSEKAEDREGYDADDRTYSRTEQGNIGLTSTQQLIREQREVVQFDIYDYIAQSFKKRFCICVY